MISIVYTILRPNIDILYNKNNLKHMENYIKNYSETEYRKKSQ